LRVGKHEQKMIAKIIIDILIINEDEDINRLMLDIIYKFTIDMRIIKFTDPPKTERVVIGAF
jgi:hypothetical protein